MKVLFAVSSESISDAIVKRYQKEYKEILSYKNVYYFNAILKEIQKDKTYDRIVISEDLESFSNNNYEAIDKFIFEKLDSISDEAQDINGNETSIILICSDRHAKGSSFLVKLFGIGIYNALLGNERSMEQVCKLINKPRAKKEAKIYYSIDSEDVNYSNKSETEVSEAEIRNILTHFKGLGRNTEKYADSFNNIASQYTNEQLKIVINCLPISVKAVLEAGCPKYQEIMTASGMESVQKEIRKNNMNEVRKATGIKLDIIENKIGQSKVSGPIVIPSSVKTSKNQGPKPMSKRVEIPIDQNTGKENRKKLEKANSLESNHNSKIESNKGKKILKKNPLLAKKKPASVDEVISGISLDNEESEKNMEEKKGRGRPRKYPVDTEPKAKGKRGRPRKSTEEDSEEDYEEDVMLPGIDSDFDDNYEDEMIPGINNEADDILPGFDDDFEDEAFPGVDDFDDELPGLDDFGEESQPENDVAEEPNVEEIEEVDDDSEHEEIEEDDTYEEVESADEELEELSDDSEYEEVEEDDTYEETESADEELEELSDDSEYEEIEEDDTYEEAESADEEFEELDDDTEYEEVEEEDEELEELSDDSEYEDVEELDDDSEYEEVEELNDDSEYEEVEELDDDSEYEEVEELDDDSEYEEVEELNDDSEYEEVEELDDDSEYEEVEELDDDSEYEDVEELDDDTEFEEIEEDDAYEEVEAEDEEFEELSDDSEYEDVEELDDDSTFTRDDELTDEVELPELDELDDFEDDDTMLPSVDDFDNIENDATIGSVDDDIALPDIEDDTQDDLLTDFDDNEEEPYSPPSMANINKNKQNQIDSIKPKIDYSMSSLNSLLTKDKKIVTFIGTTKNGTSFLINNLAALFSSLGINTAILDMTKNKNSYYIYTNNQEDLRNIAFNSISKLQKGFAEGIKVNKNLSVYTALPNDGKDYSDAEPILSTLIQNHSVVLIDCDYDTDPSYFACCQEIYLVQSMDILTIQPLTAFLRDLKTQGVLESEKVRVVINKVLKVKNLTEKVIIGGMSFYNDPSMSFMTELFNKDIVKHCIIPFDQDAYSKYLYAMAECNVSISGYSKQFLSSLKNLGDMVYPLVGKSGGK